MYAVVRRDVSTPYGMSFFTGGMKLSRYEDGDIAYQLDMSVDPTEAFQFFGYREPADFVRLLGSEDEFDIVDMNEVC
jgi:hypothetical protein